MNRYLLKDLEGFVVSEHFLVYERFTISIAQVDDLSCCSWETFGTGWVRKNDFPKLGIIIRKHLAELLHKDWNRQYQSMPKLLQQNDFTKMAINLYQKRTNNNGVGKVYMGPYLFSMKCTSFKDYMYPGEKQGKIHYASKNMNKNTRVGQISDMDRIYLLNRKWWYGGIGLRKFLGSYWSVLWDYLMDVTYITCYLLSYSIGNIWQRFDWLLS